MLFYSFQIYGDFFGYSTIALGCALCMGFTLIDNFKAPYQAGSIQEFWRRWHISLSTWFRDYLYIPLGGNRVAVPRWALNTLIVFTVCGIWHGANWTFMIWGFAYGLLLIVERGLRNIHVFDRIENGTGRRIISLLNIFKTFLVVTLLWSIFRATSFANLHDLFAAWAHNGSLPHQLHVDAVTWIALGLFIVLDLILKQRRFDDWCGQLNPYLRWAIYSVMIFGVIALSSVQHYPFIYFQF
jgi:D-alanyl-lipoteichoic acid acyltransferase DltB (MBOAT superfamily)